MVAMGTLVCVGLAGIGWIITIIVIAVTGGQRDEEVTARSKEPGFVPTPIAAGSQNRDVVAAMRAGSCRRNDVDRTRSAYLTAMRQRGAASTLRGKVALVHFKVSMPGVAWTPEASRAVTLTAATSREYLLEQAKRWRVTDLAIDAIEWPITTEIAIPPIRLDRNGKPSATDGDDLRKKTRVAIESALGRSMQTVISDIEARGYDNTGFLVSFPTGPRGVRDFAAPTGARGNAAELAYILEPDWNVAPRSLVATHELLHLFGADDLYEVRGVPPDEASDIMNAECSGLANAIIGETTAYAIGWSSVPPRRTFSFSDR